MRVDALLAAGLTRSFEFFPPKSDAESAQLATTLRDLEPLEPSFVSVTYRGGSASRQRTLELVTRVQREGRLTAVAHLTCVGHTSTELRDILGEYARAGVENVMALGGDVTDDVVPSPSSPRYALELVELAREVGTFSIGVAAHPLGHPRSADRASDRRHLAAKLRVADFAVTQFFFAAHEWSELVEDLAALGVDKPVLPGVMPVTTLRSVARMATMGAAVPPELVARLEAADRRGGAPAVRDEGVRAALELCQDLLTRGVPGLHFYTMNHSSATRELHRALFAV